VAEAWDMGKTESLQSCRRVVSVPYRCRYCEKSERKNFERKLSISFASRKACISKADSMNIQWVLAIPFLPLFLQYVARCIALVPTSWFNWPKMLNPGPEAVDVTEAMIRSPYGVRQIM
jgi:hypothetical protein